MRLASAMGVAIVSLGMATSGYSEEAVTAEKKAPSLEKLVEPTSAALEYRHIFNGEANGDKYTQWDTVGQVRATLGLMLMGKLDTAVIFGTNKLTHDPRLQQRRPQIYSTLEINKTDSLSTMLFADIRTPQDKLDTTAKFGLEPVYTKTISLGAGALSILGDNSLYAVAGANEQPGTFKDQNRAKVNTYGGTTLRGPEGEEVAAPEVKKDKGTPDLGAGADWYLGFVPNAANKLKVSVGLEVGREWTPVYDVNTNGETTTTMVGTTTSTTKFIVSYKLSDTLSLANETDHNHAGFFQGQFNGDGKTAELGARRLLNFTTLKYTLF